MGLTIISGNNNMLIAEISISNNEAWWDENKNQWDDNENTGCKQIHRLVTLIWKRNLRQTAKLLPRLPLAVHRTTICFKMWPAFTAHFQLNRLFTTSFTVWLILHCWLCCITLPDQNYFSECIVIMSDKIYVQNYKKKAQALNLEKTMSFLSMCLPLRSPFTEEPSRTLIDPGMFPTLTPKWTHKVSTVGNSFTPANIGSVATHTMGVSVWDTGELWC